MTSVYQPNAVIDTSAMIMRCEYQARANRLLFDWCLSEGNSCWQKGRADDAMTWYSLAARSASRSGFYGELASRELECKLLDLAKTLTLPPRSDRRVARPRWVHVLTEAYPFLGHTNLVRKWIELDSASVEHSVLLTYQLSALPENLAKTVVAGGGMITQLDWRWPPLRRAAELRKIAFGQADVVVLHTHPDDVVPTVAFGVPAGPPVILVNHADHVFWVGCAIADMVQDIRESGQVWTTTCRDMRRSCIVPIPLSENSSDGNVAEHRLRSRNSARVSLGLSPDDTVFLTVGSAAKYEPAAGLDFSSVAFTLLNRCPGSRLLAVGLTNEGRWRSLSRKTNGRFIPCGYQPDLVPYHAAADIYLEGFPMGSLTAMLEAGLAGLPCIRSPQPNSPPFCSDGVAFSEVTQPLSVDDFINRALQLAQNPGVRVVEGRRLRELIVGHHCSTGWRRHLEAMRVSLPLGHGVYVDSSPSPVPNKQRDYWLQVVESQKTERTAEQQLSDLLFEVARRGCKPTAEGALSILNRIHLAHNPPGEKACKIYSQGEVKGKLRHAIRRGGAHHALKSDAPLLAFALILWSMVEMPAVVLDPASWKILLKSLRNLIFRRLPILRTGN